VTRFLKISWRAEFIVFMKMEEMQVEGNYTAIHITRNTGPSTWVNHVWTPIF
jgi:hypothetical protein